MELLLIFHLFILSSGAVFITDANDWTHQGQANWYDNYKECSLNHQSPIEINARDAIIAFFIPPVIYHNYNATCPKAGKITNNGHTANIVLSKECTKPQLTGGPLPYDATFTADSFHFHWGSKDSHGSEHIINSERHSMEAHIVHRNVKYPTVEEAAKHRDGLAVQAIFYDAKVCRFFLSPLKFVDLIFIFKGSDRKGFAGLQGIVKSLKAITKFNTTAEFKGLRLDALMGNLNTSRFYTYQGSLTTPPCSQAVTWIVLPQAIKISQSQLQQFRQLFNSQGNALVNNYRFLQPKGIRKVYFRWNMLPPTDANAVNNAPYKLPPTPVPSDNEENLDFLNLNNV